jgi:AraC-like DNA-binding protein
VTQLVRGEEASRGDGHILDPLVFKCAVWSFRLFSEGKRSRLLRGATLPPRRDERALRTMLQHALSLIVLQYRRDRLLANRARMLVTARPSEQHTAPALANALNVSVRTLHRQLEEEGTSLQALRDAVRRDRAIEQLCRTSQPIKQIALSVGFASEKTFARAFR